MRAILWDGQKQLLGKLSLNEVGISFELQDFKETSLSFSIPYSSMTRVCNYRLYDQSSLGVEICSVSGRRNVFVVEDAEELIDSIKRRKEIII